MNNEQREIINRILELQNEARQLLLSDALDGLTGEQAEHIDTVCRMRNKCAVALRAMLTD